jgi:hypothetical protein
MPSEGVGCYQVIVVQSQSEANMTAAYEKDCGVTG